MKGIFYNSQSASCSIYESGLMCYKSLTLSPLYDIEYSEQQSPLNHDDYDFIVINHHPVVNRWIEDYTYTLRNKKTFGIVTEVGHDGHIMPYTPLIFDNYIILDPTVIDTPPVFGFSRPLELYENSTYHHKDIVIGSFGFPTVDKNWEEIVYRAKNEFSKAHVRFNIPFATYVPYSKSEVDRIRTSCESIIQNSGITLEITSTYFSKQELVDWCSQNTINVFLYNRNMTGLSATTDQAIIAERPLLVSQNPTFRHILQYLHPYPKSITEAIETTLPAVQQMKKDWSPYMFTKKFENILFGER